MTAAGTGRFKIAPLLMAIVLTVLLVLLLGEAAHLFLLLFLAILISLALGALADVVTRYTRVPRRYALIIAIVLALSVVVGFMWLIVPVVIEQTQSLLGTLPDRLIAWQKGIDEAAGRGQRTVRERTDAPIRRQYALQPCRRIPASRSRRSKPF